MTSTTRNREPMFLEVAANKYVRLSAKRTSFAANTLTAIGGTFTEPTGAGVQIDAVNKGEAAQRGIFFLAVYYAGRGGRTQRAIVPVAPSKADTAFNDLKSATYNGKNILKVSAVRRVKYVI
jgi:hypothetical protein